MSNLRAFLPLLLFVVAGGVMLLVQSADGRARRGNLQTTSDVG